MICLARMRRDPRTQEYLARRTQEGKSKREIIRCLKRYVAREAYRVLISCATIARRQLQKMRSTSPLGAAPLDHRSVTRVNRAPSACNPLPWMG
jgi:hypothetical protein